MGYSRAGWSFPSVYIYRERNWHLGLLLPSWIPYQMRESFSLYVPNNLTSSYYLFFQPTQHQPVSILLQSVCRLHPVYDQFAHDITYTPINLHHCLHHHQILPRDFMELAPGRSLYSPPPFLIHWLYLFVLSLLILIVPLYINLVSVLI